MAIEWISVKNRQPEKSGRYLTTIKGNNTPDEARIMDLTLYATQDDPLLGEFVGWVNRTNCEVLAWAEGSEYMGE